MRRFVTSSLLALAFTAPVFAAGESPDTEGGQDAPQADDEKKAAKEERQKAKAEAKAERLAKRRQLDTESPEAQALDELLAIDPRYATDGTVELVYTFTAPEHSADFDQTGFDVAEEGRFRNQGRNLRARKRAKAAGLPSRFLNLTVGSQRKGLLQHRLPMKGEFEVEFSVLVDRMTGRSDLVFVVGKAGLRFGSQLVKASGSSFTPAVRGPVDRTAFERGGRVNVKLVCGSGTLTAWVNGTKVAETAKLDGKLDGKIGLFARDMSLTVHQITIRGEVDKRKL